MKMHVEQGRTAFLDRAAKGHLDHFGIVEVLGLPKVEDQMAAGIAETMSFDEVIFDAVFSGGLTRMDQNICSGVVRLRFSIHTNLGKRVLIHIALLQTRMNPKD